MSNPLYDQMSGQIPPGIMQRFQQFQQMFRGDPRQQIQKMLNSGKIRQGQYNQAVQIAQKFQRMMGIK